MCKDIFWLSIVFFISCSSLSSSQSKSRPNIVVILADDLGYSDVGYMHMKPGIQTPNIDQLAKSGIIFTDAYASCPVCSPTRASFYTGKYPATLKLTCHIPGMGMQKYLKKFNEGKKRQEAYFLDHLPLEELTIAEVLKKEGYKTGFIGKWHLAGEGSALTTNGVVDANYHPEKQGFDLNIGGCAYGQPSSYFSPYKNAAISDGNRGEYLTDRLGDEAVKFIADNKDEPFFLNLCTYTVHTPLIAPTETVEKYGGNKYFAMIEKLDQNVGKVINALREQHLLENTVIFFYSDNGGLWDNAPLRNKKGSLYEGGIRVPLIVSWAQHIKAGEICSQPVTSVDFFPTLLELAKVCPTEHPELEGVSLLPIINGNGSISDRAIYWHFPHHRANTELAMAAAIREGDWKLVKEFESEELHLFNLNEDIGEKVNLSTQYPKKTFSLLKKLEEWQRKVSAEMPKPNTEYNLN